MNITKMVFSSEPQVAFDRPDPLLSLSRREGVSNLLSKPEKTTSDFATTLTKVSKDSRQSHTDPQEKKSLQDIVNTIDDLIAHPEKQTKENMEKLLSQLLSFLTASVINPSFAQKTTSASLQDLKQLLLQWENGKKNNHDFLLELSLWLKDAFATLLQSPNLVQKPSLQPKSAEDNAKEESKGSESGKISLEGLHQQEMHQPKVEEKSSTTFRVLDKRFSQTNSFSTSTVAKKTDVASSVIDHLIKNIEKQTETKESPLPMGVRFAQDVGVKVVFPEHTSLARVSVEHLLQQVAGKALITLRDGQSEMRLQLTPPELGRMDMKIVLEDGQMKGKIVVSTPEAKALFDQNLGELQRQLQQVGIQLGQLDVSLGQFERGDSSQSNMDSSFSSLGNVEGVLSTEEVVSSSLWESNAVNYIV